MYLRRWSNVLECIQCNYAVCEGPNYMKTRIVRIGNSRGVRLPKPLIEEAGLGDEVELRVVETGLLIERAPQSRTGWADAAALMHERGEDSLLDEPSATDFDESEWVWE